MLTLKLTLVPLFLLIVSLSGVWWGPTVAGWLAGLPVVAGPILYLLVLSNGPEFGAHAATLSLSAILASEAYSFAYAWTCRSRGWVTSLTVGLLTWAVSVTLLSFLPASPTWAIGVALVGVGLGQSFLPRSSEIPRGAPATKGDLAGRMSAGALLTVVVTSLSSEIGAAWSGLFAVFPLMGIVLSVSSHRAHGAEFVVSLLRGMVIGRFSFAAFLLALIFFLQREPTGVVFLAAGSLAMMVQWLTKTVVLHSNRRTIKVPSSS